MAPAVIGGDGIRFFNSTINSGLVSLHRFQHHVHHRLRFEEFASHRQHVHLINGHGVEFIRVTATDVTIKNTDIAENTCNGVVVIGGSSFHDFTIQDSIWARF